MVLRLHIKVKLGGEGDVDVAVFSRTNMSRTTSVFLCVKAVEVFILVPKPSSTLLIETAEWYTHLVPGTCFFPSSVLR